MAGLSEAVYQYEMHIIFSVTGGGKGVDGGIRADADANVGGGGGNMKNIGSGGGV